MKQQAKPYFPMFVDLTEQKILVIGGGTVALRKTRTLMRFCEHIAVVAPEIRPEFAQMETLQLAERPWRESDLDGIQIAVIASDDEKLNARIAEICRARGILRNTASDRHLCDFYFPSVTERDGVVIGIGSGGDPAGTKKIREELELFFADKEKADEES